MDRQEMMSWIHYCNMLITHTYRNVVEKNSEICFKVGKSLNWVTIADHIKVQILSDIIITTTCKAL